MKIKFLNKVAKNEIGSISEIDDVKAKMYIDDGLAEIVTPTDSEKAVDNFKSEIINLVKDTVASSVKEVTKSFKTNHIVVGETRELLDPSGGFKSLGHFLRDVKRAGESFQTPSETMKKYFAIEALRMKTAGATPTDSEGTPSLVNGQTGDGAQIPVEYLSEVIKMYGDQPDFYSMAFPIQMNSLAVHVPVVRNYNRANTTNTLGLITTEDGEGNLKTLSKLNWEQVVMNAVVESVVAPINNEVLEDSNINVVGAVTAQAIYQLRKRINGGMINGLTTSQTGIFGSSGTTGTGIHASTKIVGRATANSVGFADLVNMYSYFDHEGANWNTAIWLMNPTVLQYIMTSTVGSYPAFITPGGGPNGLPVTIFGRPVYLTGYMNSIGNTADVAVFDPKQYLAGYRGGLQTFVSPHVYCISYQTAIRFTQRVVGQPLRTAKVIIEDGSTTVASSLCLGQVGGLS